MAAQEMASPKTAVQALLTQAVADGASDVHFEPQENRLRVRFRIHGKLWETTQLPGTFAPSVANYIKALAHMNMAEKRLPLDGSCTFETGNRKYDLRISSLPVFYGEKIVVRILGNPLFVPQLERLGLLPAAQSLLVRELRRSAGLIVVAGATGTGKSTTLAAALAFLNDSARNLVSIEDPIEYHLPGVNQVQVNEQSGLTFAKGLRSILRQDPDVIAVGEIRDRETAEIAIRAALTGHLVLSSMHANTAAEIPLRFVEMGIAPYLVAASLTLVISQRLLRLLCPACKQPYRGVAPWAEESTDSALFTRGGCERCHATGYSGRTGIFEMLTLDESIKNQLALPEGIPRLRSLCGSLTRFPLAQQVRERIAKGEVGVEEAAFFAN